MAKKKKKTVTWDDLEGQTNKDRNFSKGKMPMLKLKEGKNKILILSSYKENKFVKDVLVHRVWKNQRVVAKATSPLIKDGEIDKVLTYGRGLKDKFENSKNEKLKSLYRLFYPSFNESYVNALDLNDIKAGVQVLKLPVCAVEAIHDSRDDFDSPEEVFDLNDGHALVIKAKGKGRNRSYTNAKFITSKTVGLIDKDKVDEEEIMGSLHNLDFLQPKLDEKELDKVLDLLKDVANRIIKEEGGSTDDEDDEDEDDIEEVDMDDDDEEDLDEDDEDDDDDDDESEDDEDDEDDEEDDSDEDDEEEDEEEDEEPVRKKKKKSVKKSKKKTKKKKKLKKKRK